MIFLTVAVIFIIFCIVAYCKHARQIELSGKLAGPKGFPIVGNGLELINKTPQEFIKIIAGYIQKHGKFFRLWLANQMIIICVEPKDIEAILTNMKLITKSSEYNYMKPWLSTGLLTSTGQKWINRRKILTPAFHFKILEDFVDIFDKQTSILVQKLKPHEGRGGFNIFPVTALCALDIICETAMGISLNSQNDLDSDYVKNVNELADIIHRRTYDFAMRYEMIFKFTATYRRQQKKIKALHDFTDKVIIARREKLLSGSLKKENEDEGFGTRKKMNLLDILLVSTIEGKFLSNEDIREEIDTFMFEGHDTTNSGLAFTFYNIAKHQHIQEKCFDEICKVIGDDKNASVDMKKLNDLKYLELVIKETLRLHPSVPIFGRTATEEIEINGKCVPKGANIIVTPYFMARDPDIFKDPLKFIPERFDVETTADKMNPYAFIPFSAGSRNCIGQKFAMLELKATVSKVLRHFKLSLENGFEPEDSLELVIKSKNGVMIKLEERTM